MERLAKLGLEKTYYLARPGKPTCLCLAENELTVNRHLKASAAGATQLDRPHYWRPTAQHLIGQAHGPLEIASRDAELDLHLVLRIDHATF